MILPGKGFTMNTEYYDDSRLGKNLTMPLETTLQLQINGLADRFTGVLVGMVTDEYLIIQGKFENITTDLYNGNKTHTK